MVNIPSDWVTQSLGDLGQVRTCRRVYQEETHSTGPVPFYKIGTFGGTPDAYISTDLYEKYVSSFPYPVPGATLISTAGTIGRVVRFAGEKAYFQDSNIVWVHIDENRVDSQFFYYFLESFPWGAVEATTIDRLYNSAILSTPIALPPIPEQRAIADVLAGFDEHLSNLDALIAKKKDVRDGALEELVTGLHRVEGFTSRWKSVQLSQLVTLRNETIAMTSNIDIELENLVPGEGRITGDTTPRTSSSFSFRKGDVLFGRLRPYLKKYWLANCEGVRSGEIWALSATELIHPEFLFQLVRTRKFLSAANRTTGTKMPRADWNLLKEHMFLLPPLDEQAAIASVLSSMDAEIAALVEERAKVERLKQGAMEDLLTGCVRLLVHEEAS